MVLSVNVPVNDLMIVPTNVIPVPVVPSMANTGLLTLLKLRSPSDFSALVAFVSIES